MISKHLLFMIFLVFWTAGLSGCLITVAPTPGGSVVSSDDEVCSPTCIYSVETGGSLVRSFVAVPDAGYQFSHWSDNLKNLLHICTSPTQPDCRVLVGSLLPSLEGFPVNIKAHFRAITGYSLAYVEFSDGEQLLGALRQMPSGAWVEDSVSELNRFTFAETGRDATTVYLHDDSRDFGLEIDLADGNIRAVEGGEEPVVQYQLAYTVALVNGWMVNEVWAGNALGGPLVRFVQTGAASWEELNSRLVPEHFFAEIGRDSWSVYLYDDTRGVTLQLDLYTGQVLYSEDGLDTSQPLYTIQHTRRAVDGYWASEVEISNSDGAVTSRFTQRGADAWVEQASGSDAVTFSFVETERSRAGITLLDEARGAEVLLDLLDGLAYFRVLPDGEFYPFAAITGAR